MSLSNNFPNTSPTLMLDFINNDRLDPRITYTRNSSATYVSSSGTIKLVSNNVPRFEYDSLTLDAKGLLIEEDRINLLSSTKDLWNSPWTKRSIGNTITHMNSITAPDGTLTGTLMCDGTASNLYIRPNTSLMGTAVMANNTVYTSSIFVKKKDAKTIYLQMYAKNPLNSDFVSSVLDLNTGNVTMDNGGTITDYGAGVTQYADGWWRLWATINSGANTGNGIVINFTPALPTGTSYGNGNNSAYFWGPQCEAGAFPTSYIPSVETFTSRNSSGTYYGSDGLIKTASANTARYQYNPQNLVAPPVLLVEPAKANLLLYSNSFGTSPWTLSNATLSANSILSASPDGTTNATVLIENSSNTAHQVRQEITTALNTVYVFSVYAKAKERDRIRVNINADAFGVAQYANFNLSAGTVTLQFGNAKGHMVYVGNGWYRCSVTTINSVAAAAVSAAIVLLDPTTGTTGAYAGDSASGVYLWGAQIEAGTQDNGFTVTSYIDTGAAQVTRSADTFTSTAQSRAQDSVLMTESNFTSWYNKNQGTFVWSGDFNVPDRTQGFRVVDSANNTLRGIGANFTRSGNNITGLFLSRNDEGLATVTSPIITTNNQIVTMAGSYSNTSNVIAASFFGSSATDTAGAYAFGTENRLEIGGKNSIDGTSIVNYNGHQRKLAYYPVKVSNDQLSNLTKTLI